MNFSWIPYYKEFADKLLLFKNNRNSLLRLIYDNREELLARYFHDEKVRMIYVTISLVSTKK